MIDIPLGKALFETSLQCGKTTCNDCEWVYGEAVGDPYCGWFNWYAVQKPEDTRLGAYKADKHTLLRLPECLAAEVKR